MADTKKLDDGLDVEFDAVIRKALVKAIRAVLEEYGPPKGRITITINDIETDGGSSRH
jgi:hypothetical protein